MIPAMVLAWGVVKILQWRKTRRAVDRDLQYDCDRQGGRS